MKQFKIPVKEPTTYRGIRFPNDLIQEVENAIQGKNCSFSAFVVEATKVAVDSVKISK